MERTVYMYWAHKWRSTCLVDTDHHSIFAVSLAPIASAGPRSLGGGLRHQGVDFTSDGVPYTVYYGGKGIAAAPKWIIYQHGNACDMRLMHPILKRYAEAVNWNIVSWEYPGYGPHGGYIDMVSWERILENSSTHNNNNIKTYTSAKPNESSINAALRSVIQHVVRHHKVDLCQIVLFGQSIGTGPSVWAAQEFPTIAGLVLQSPYLSILDIAQHLLNTRVVKLVSSFWNPWNSQETMRRVRCRVLLLHGELDTLIPVQHSHTLLGLAPKGSTIQTFSRVDHNNWTDQIILPPLRDYLNSLQSG